MTWTEKDKERLDLSISLTKSLLESALEEQRINSERILRLRIELACFEHCREEIA